MTAVLIKFPGEALSVDVIAALLRVPEIDLRVYHAVDHPQTYAWLTAPIDRDTLQAVAQGAHPHAKLVALTLTTDVAGHSTGQPAAWLYMVETDIKPEAQQDFDSWYETEHLPGLASVPGTVRARRYLANESAPRYYACYDLTQREVFGSAPWLAVRATPWSDRVRPNFINTTRTMFRLVQVKKEV